MLRILAAIALIVTLTAADWPQFRGPQRDGASADTGLMQAWPKDGPKLLWTYSDAGVGFAGPAVVGTGLFLSGGRGDADVLFALDTSGAEPKQVWEAKIGPLFQWKGNTWNAGPNVTPTVDGDAVYALGGFGDLVCVAASDGKERWRVNLPKDLGGEVNPIGGGLEDPTPLGWGYSAAPLIDGDKVICAPGGKKGLLAALDKKTGKVLWQTASAAESASYASPVVAEIGGVRQYVQVSNKGLVGVGTDGRVLWQYKRGEPFDDVVITAPVVKGDLVFATVGFGQGCDLIKVTKKGDAFAAEKVYGTREMQNRDGGVVLVGDHLFGHSEKGGWMCMDFKTGKVAWAENELLGRGSVSLADGRLYCAAEKGGAVVLLEPSAKEWKEAGRFKLPKESKKRLPSGMLWTHPVVAGGKLFVRDQEFVFCFDVKK